MDRRGPIGFVWPKLAKHIQYMFLSTIAIHSEGLVFGGSLAGRQYRPGGVVIADRKFAPRPGAPFVAVEGARLKVFIQAPKRNDCVAQ